MLTVAINGLHECSHAAQSHETITGSQVVHPEISFSHHCPCVPFEQHNDFDGCDTCANCSCHAPLTIHPFQIAYNPIILDLSTFAPFNFLPEVYLSLFVPPDSAVV
jgi:hypothetical protein